MIATEKQVPLVIEELVNVESGDRWGYMARGHHDDALFLEALKVGRWVREPEKLEPVERAWWRWVPRRGDADREGVPAAPGSRGAFKVTCARVID